MSGLTLPVVVIGAAISGLLLYFLFRVMAALRELRAGQRTPDQALLLLQRSIEDVRSESRAGQENTLGAVRKDFGELVCQIDVPTLSFPAPNHGRPRGRDLLRAIFSNPEPAFG